jgi:hypothetical protein
VRSGRARQQRRRFAGLEPMEWCAHLDAIQFFEVVDHLTKN